MRFPSVSVAVAAVLSLASNVHAKYIFAHYMVGETTADHAHQDIEDAAAMGLDGFALNIGDPTAQFTLDLLNNMFGYAANRGGFKLYISMDLYAYGDGCSKAGKTCNKMSDYKDVLGWMQNGAYFRDTPNGFPLVTTFSSGGGTWREWHDWKESWANEMYLIPDIDETTGYYSGVDAWWYYWGNITDGVSSWESSWPVSSTRVGFGGAYAGDVSPDNTVIAAAKSRDKGYMMGLSTLQYKDSYGANVYRGGELNLPKRMEGILGMPIQPDYIQVITWNDGPEGHYIGNLWPESNTDVEPNNYANQEDWGHQPWQGVISSFIRAWKAGGSTSSMTPLSGLVEGVMWYKTLLQSAVCPNDGISKYYSKPDNFDTGLDQINYAVVVAAGVTTLTARCYINGVAFGPVRNLVPGLNYGECQGTSAGTPRLAVDSAGSIISAANGVACISSGCPQGMYNMNYQTVSLAADNGKYSAGDCLDYSVGTYVGGAGVFVKKEYNPTAEWRSVSCSYGALTDTSNDPTQQWTDAQAATAWNDAIYSWKNSRDTTTSTQSFVDYMANFFHSKPSLACNDIQDVNCDTTFGCGESSGPNAAIDTPAGYLIVNSFISIHHAYDNIYNSLAAVQSGMALEIGTFASVFSPTFNNNQALAIFLDFITTGFGLISVPLMDSWVKKLPSVVKNPDSNVASVIGDSTVLLVNQAIGLARDLTIDPWTPLKQQNAIAEFLKKTIDAWFELLSNQLTSLFDGSDASIATLGAVIDNNAVAFAVNQPTVRELQPVIEKALYGFMIPTAWNASTLNVLPFIATNDGVAQSTGSTGCDGWNPGNVKDINSGPLATDDGIQNFVCGAGTDNAPFWITNVLDNRISGCNEKPFIDCGTVVMGVLPGLNAMDGSGVVTGKWGGLTRDDLVISAVNAWKKNGKKNGWAKADPATADTVREIYSNGIRATGIVNIPVCSFYEALDNIAQGKKTDNYPCT